MKNIPPHRRGRVESEHVTVETIETEELSPPHPPREDTPAYRKAHQFLIHDKKSPCVICGVTIETLARPGANPLGSRAMETHHYPIERSLVEACDPVKVHRDFPQVYDHETLLAFVDSPANLITLCDICHRSQKRGIHHLTNADFWIQKYLWDGYIVAASPTDVAQAIASDAVIMHQHRQGDLSHDPPTTA